MVGGQLMAQALTLPVAGLMADPGPFTAAPDGGLVEAQNVVVLRPGVIEPRPAFQASVDSVLKAADYYAQAMYSGETRGFVVASDALWSAWSIRSLLATVTGPTQFKPGMIRFMPTGGRLLLTSQNGVCTLPGQLASPENGVTSIAYRAGMPQPYVPLFVGATVPAGYPAAAAWLPNGESVAYRVTLRRRLANGTIVESAPSARVVYANATGAARGVRLDSILSNGIYYAWAPNGAGADGFNDLLDGDELCIYRSPRIAGTPSDEMRLRAVLTYNSFTTIVNGIAAAWFDGLDDASWSGAALYTNNTQDGAGLANFRPEYARDIALYNGMTFYGGAKTPQRVDAVLKLMGAAAAVTDPAQAMCSFAFTGDTTIATNTILNCTNARFFSVGQVLTGGSFAAGTYVTAINVTTLTVTVSANAGATAAGVAMVAWDWVQTTDATPTVSRIYFDPGGLGAAPSARVTSSVAYGAMLTAQGLEAFWNGDNDTQIQLRCSGVTSTTEIVCSWFQPDCTDAAFSAQSSKPLAWDVYLDNTTGVTSQQFGGVADLQWTKPNEPEHCPLPYRSTIGAADKAIRRIVSARNSLLIFKDDGLFQWFGDTPTDYRIEMLDSTVRLPYEDLSVGDDSSKWVEAFDDRVYAMTTRGPMEIGDAGARPVGAPILETLRQTLGPTMRGQIYGRALMIDIGARRVGFFYDPTNDKAVSHGYVLSVDTGAWTKWTTPYWVGAFSVTATATVGFGSGYRSGSVLDTRVPVAASSASTTYPPSYDQYPSEVCTINSVTGTGPYTVTIASGSEWIPAVGDIFFVAGGSAGVRMVTSVTSSTVFETDIAIAIATPIANVRWLSGFECRVVWLARAEGNVGAEKHWRSVAFPMERTLITQRLKRITSGYRNTSAASEEFIATSQSIGAAPYTFAPQFVRWFVPTAFGRDWAIKVGFSIKQAGCWFSTSGVSVLFEPVAADRVAR
jgi:hypothetical protein